MAPAKKQPADKPDHPHGGPPGQQPPPAGVRTDVTAASTARGVAVANTWVIPAGAAPLAELPRVYLDTTYPDTTGYVTYTVKASGGTFTSLHTAVNSTSPAVKNATTGIILAVDAGYTLTENVVLPVHTNPWVIIQSSALASLPAAGTRVAPSDASNMPTIQSASNNVIGTATGAHHYRLVGLHVRPTGYVNSVVTLGDNTETVLANLAHHLTVDRCYIHGHVTSGSRRGVTVNSGTTAVIDSYIADIKEVGADTQAVGGWNSPGPVKIVNNYLEGAGENVMFGGSDPAITNLVTSDMEVRHNYFFKPRTWKSDDPSYLGTLWSIKNLFELKNAQRVLVDGNLFEQTWSSAQDGYAILFTSLNQGNTAPWTVVQDVTFTNNIIRHATRALQFVGSYNQGNATLPTRRILVRNNLWEDISAAWGSTENPASPHGIIMTIGHGGGQWTLDHNTIFHAGQIISVGNFGEPPLTDIVFTNNIVVQNAYGILGDSCAPGNSTITTFFPVSTITKNCMIGPDNTAIYPAGNYFPADTTAMGFVNYAGGDYHLTSGSPYHQAASDGTDVGCNIDTLLDAQP